MKVIVATFIAAVAAVTCTVIATSPRAVSARSRYQLHAFEEMAPGTGRIIRTTYRIDVSTGKTWRLGSAPSIVNPDKTILGWAEGWEEVPESVSGAVAKAQAEWRAAVTGK